MEARKVPPRKDGRVIIHFDYDCFYAAVFEAKNPALRSLPFAVQQKQIIVTCNYEARRRGLHKLQLIRDARRVCPEVIIELGEDISRFRDVSKDLYNFISAFSWNGRIERLGFDEVWMDVTDMVEYNLQSVNQNNLSQSFFQMSRDDPLLGFEFDAACVAGHTFPKKCAAAASDGSVDDLSLRLCLGSHLALYLRHQLEGQKGYSCTVGIATNKMLSKLVGNVNKPKAQTTLMPPFEAFEGSTSNALSFLDDHEIGKIPGIGFKLAQKLREFFLGRSADFDAGLVYGGTKENVTVASVREHPDVSADMLEKLLGGPGSPHGIGYKVWCLLHGVDDTEVGHARAVPRQISIEDSYIRLDTMPEVLKQLDTLARSLVNRMRIDLLGEEDDFNNDKADATDVNTVHSADSLAGKKWLAHPKTLRLTTRPRQPLQPDGTRVRSFKRISHSAPLPKFIFSLHDSVDALSEKLVKEALLPMFRKLHPEKAGWNLSLVNLAVANMAEAAGATKTASGRDIGSMFRRQEDVLKDFKVTDLGEHDLAVMDVVDPKPQDINEDSDALGRSEVEESMDNKEGESDNCWDDEGGLDGSMEFCSTCSSRIPAFAMLAHQRFHSPSS